jgi:hypothetical protein
MSRDGEANGTFAASLLPRTLSVRPRGSTMRRTTVLLLASLVSACSSAPTGAPSSYANSALTPSPGASVGFVWTRQAGDPGPGPVVVGILAEGLKVQPDRITAAVYFFAHPAGNTPWIWVFRADAVASTTAIDRWASFEGRCPGPIGSVSLDGLPATQITRHLVDQCEPEYLVPLDATTVALIVDDGGYRGNAHGSSHLAYRPVEEIGQLVAWLRDGLPTMPLMTGGPMPSGQ